MLADQRQLVAFQSRFLSTAVLRLLVFPHRRFYLTRENMRSLSLLLFITFQSSLIGHVRSVHTFCMDIATTPKNSLSNIDKKFSEQAVQKGTNQLFVYTVPGGNQPSFTLVVASADTTKGAGDALVYILTRLLKQANPKEVIGEVCEKYPLVSSNRFNTADGLSGPIDGFMDQVKAQVSRLPHGDKMVKIMEISIKMPEILIFVLKLMAKGKNPVSIVHDVIWKYPDVICEIPIIKSTFPISAECTAVNVKRKVTKVTGRIGRTFKRL